MNTRKLCTFKDDLTRSSNKINIRKSVWATTSCTVKIVQNSTSIIQTSLSQKLLFPSCNTAENTIVINNNWQQNTFERTAQDGDRKRGTKRSREREREREGATGWNWTPAIAEDLLNIWCTLHQLSYWKVDPTSDKASLGYAHSVHNSFKPSIVQKGQGVQLSVNPRSSYSLHHRDKTHDLITWPNWYLIFTEDEWVHLIFNVSFPVTAGGQKHVESKTLLSTLRCQTTWRGSTWSALMSLWVIFCHNTPDHSCHISTGSPCFLKSRSLIQNRIQFISLSSSNWILVPTLLLSSE